MVKEKMSKKELKQHVTTEVLFEFTDSVLLPRINDLITARLAEQEYRLKDYMDKKFATFESDLTKRYDRRYILKKA